MVVTFVANTGAIGGSELYLINLTNRLHDYECRVLMPSSPAAEEFKRRAKAARVDELPTDGYSLHPRAFAKSVAFYRGVCTDILHFNLANPSVSTIDIMAAKLCCRAPIVVTSHTPYVSRTRRELATARIALTCADHVIVVCEESRRHVSSLGINAHKVTTIYNGVPDHMPSGERVSEIRQALGVADSGSILFGTVARLEEQKGLACLLRAFQGVVRKVSKAKLCIIGDGSQGGELRTLAAYLGIVEKVMFMPWMPSYLDHVAAFDVFVLPSLCESFPFAIVEAMMAGKPVVASDVGGVREAVSHGETGFLVLPKEVERLAEAILALVRSPELRARMGAKARSVALSKFSDVAMVRATTRLYEEIIAERRDRRKE